GAGVPVAVAVAGSSIRSLLVWRRWPAGRPRGPPADPPSLARAGLGQLLDRRDVRLVDEARAREHRLAAADRVGVLAVQLQEHHRQVALQVLLLVDGELDVARLDVLEDVGAEVERRERRVRARALDRRLRGRRDVRVQRDDAVEGLVGLQLGLDLGLRRRDVRGALHLEVGHRAAEALLHAVAALLQADVVLLVDDAEGPLDGVGLQPRAGRLAGDRLRLADVRDRSERLEVVGARVQRHDRDAGRLGLRQRVLDRARVRHRHRQPVDLLRDGSVDQLRLLLRVVVGRAPDELHALVLCSLLRALLDDTPARALVAVGDHRDREAAALRLADALRAAAGRGGRPTRAGGLVAATAAGRHDERGDGEDGQEHPGGQSLHRWNTSLRGARVDRNSMLLRTSRTG